MPGRREVLMGAMAAMLPWTRAGAGERVIVSRVRLTGARVLMSVGIGGEGPFEFLLDTGGFLSFMKADLAKRLKLEQRGFVRGAGVGGRATFPLYLARDVVFGGGARQPSVALAGVDGFGFGPGVDGALAAGFLTSVDSDLDLAAGEWRAYPDGRPARQGYVRLNDAIRGGDGARGGSPRLFGTAAVDGVQARFLLDTGAPGAVTLSHADARRMKLWDDERPYSPVRPHGLGGKASVGRLVRVERFDFAGVTINRPLVLLSGPGELAAEGQADGVIGLALLRRFNLATEVRSSDLLVQDRGGNLLPERYGMSGLWIEREGERLNVQAVGRGSPAVEAGVAVGDRIVGMPFDQAIRALAGAPGTTVSLDLERGGGRRSVRFALREYL